MKPEDLKVDFAPRLETVKVEAPPTRQGGAKVSPSHSNCKLCCADTACEQVESVDEVVSKLKEAGVL